MAGRSDIRAGGAFVELTVKNSAFLKGLRSAQDHLRSFASAARVVGSAVIGVGTAITGSLVAAASVFAKVGSDLQDMAARTGVSTTALSEFGHAASMTGASLSDVETAIRKMQKSLTDAQQGSKSANEALKQIGLTAAELKGLTPEQQFEKIAAAIAAIKDPTTRAAAAMELFGKSGTKLLPMLGNLSELRKEANELGLVITPEMAARADALGDAWDRFKGALQGVALQIGSALAPSLTTLLETLGDSVIVLRDMTASSTDFGDEFELTSSGVIDALGFMVDAINEVHAAWLDFAAETRMFRGFFTGGETIEDFLKIGEDIDRLKREAKELRESDFAERFRQKMRERADERKAEEMDKDKAKPSEPPTGRLPPPRSPLALVIPPDPRKQELERRLRELFTPKGELPTAEQLRRGGVSSAATFSAAGAIALGQGGGAVDQMVGEIKESNKKLGQLNRTNEIIKAVLDRVLILRATA